MSANEEGPKRFHPALRLPFRAASCVGAIAGGIAPIYPAMIAATNDMANAGFYFGSAGFVGGALLFNGLALARSAGNTFIDYVRNAFTAPKLKANFACAAAIPVLLTIAGYAMGYDKPIPAAGHEIIAQP